MRILGIDTSGKVAAASLYDTDTRRFLAQQTVYTQKTHSQVILPLAERMLHDTGLTLQELDGLAVAKGPGSYTGLRIGIAAVQAMGFALGIPCTGVSALAGLAWQNAAWNGLICTVMAARKDLYYVGFYRSDGTNVNAAAADGILEQGKIVEQLKIWNEPVLFAGDGAETFRTYPHGTIAPPYAVLQNGTGICLAAAYDKCWQKPEQLKPAYLQLVKAEKDLQQNTKKAETASADGCVH